MYPWIHCFYELQLKWTEDGVNSHGRVTRPIQLLMHLKVKMSHFPGRPSTHFIASMNLFVFTIILLSLIVVVGNDKMLHTVLLKPSVDGICWVLSPLSPWLIVCLFKCFSIIDLSLFYCQRTLYKYRIVIWWRFDRLLISFIIQQKQGNTVCK